MIHFKNINKTCKPENCLFIQAVDFIVFFYRNKFSCRNRSIYFKSNFLKNFYISGQIKTLALFNDRYLQKQSQMNSQLMWSYLINKELPYN